MVKGEKNEYICNYCKKPDHFKSYCFKLLRKNQAEGRYVGTRNGIARSATTMVLNTMTANDKIDSKIWIGNSGTYCNSKEFLYNYIIISEEITVGNGNKMISKKVENLRCTVQLKNGESCIVVLQSVKLIPDIGVILFCISKALKMDSILAIRMSL
jgi:hypothetical protein